MKYLLISLLFLSITSCALETTKDLVAIEIINEYAENTYFSEVKNDYVYKAKIEVYGNNFGGILIIKKTNKDTHRVVFTTEFGNKLFDFLYEGDSFTLNYIVEELDKKLIINTLRKDFKILVSEKIKTVKQYQTENVVVSKTIDDKRANFYFYNKKTHTLDKIVNASKANEKVIFLFENITSQNANSIKINHKNIKLSIALEKF